MSCVLENSNKNEEQRAEKITQQTQKKNSKQQTWDAQQRAEY